MGNFLNQKLSLGRIFSGGTVTKGLACWTPDQAVQVQPLALHQGV